jgi:hypothetical protein
LCGYHHKNQRGLELKIILPIENGEEPLIIYNYKIHVMKTNESMIPTCSVSLLTATFEMFSKYNLIKLLSNADSEFEKILNVLLHAATSTSNSLESESNDLKQKNLKQRYLHQIPFLII